MEHREPPVRIRWEPDEVAPGLFRLPLPYAYGSSVNVLAVPTREGVLLIDAGYRSDDARDVFAGHLAQLGIERRSIRAILITHADVDHVGLANELHEASGARVLIHGGEVDREPRWRRSRQWLVTNGYEGPPLDARTEPPRLPDALEVVGDGDHVRWGAFDFRLIHCPGHTPGLLCAHDGARGVLLSTDHVLRASTPVGLYGPEGDPLGDYLRSLERLRGLHAPLIVPGHGRAFSGLDERLEAIRDGVERELEKLRAELGESPASAWEIARRMHPGDDGRRRAMATFIVLAGLRRLERRGQAVAIAADGIVSYRAA